MYSTPTTHRAEDLSTPRSPSSTTTPRSTRESVRSLSPLSSSSRYRVTTSSPKVSLPYNQKGKHKSTSSHIPPQTTQPQTIHIPQTPHTPTIHDSSDSMSIETLRAAYKKLQHKAVDLQHKLVLQEEKGRSDAKKIQALELVLQHEAASSSPLPSSTGGRMAESKYLAQIDALSSKLYKMEERNQSLVEEMASLKSDFRNKKKEYEHKLKELQLKYDFDVRALEQQQREFTSGLRKETRKDVDGLKQHLVVQETDLQKKHMRDVQDLKADQLEREMQLKEVIHRLQDELEYVKQTGKRAAIRKTVDVFNDEDQIVTIEDFEEEGDPEECY